MATPIAGRKYTGGEATKRALAKRSPWRERKTEFPKPRVTTNTDILASFWTQQWMDVVMRDLFPTP